MKQSYQQLYWTNQDLNPYQCKQLIDQFNPNQHLVIEINTHSTYDRWIDQSVITFMIQALKNTEQSHLLVLNNLANADYNLVIGDLDGLFDRDQNGFSTYPITISHDLLKQNLKQWQFDPNRFQLPPNLKIIATYNRNGKNQLPSWAFRRWDHFEDPLNKFKSSLTK